MMNLSDNKVMTEADILGRLETYLRSLLHNEHSSIHIGFNDTSGPNYQSVKEGDDDSHPSMRRDWISEEERQKGYETNSCWTLQWYPDSPVGFNSFSASSLAALIAYAKAGGISGITTDAHLRRGVSTNQE